MKQDSEQKETEFRNNIEAFEYAKTFLDVELLAFFKEAEKSGRWGSLYHHPGKKQQAEFVFNSGICLRCLEPIRGKNNTFVNSTKYW